MAKQKNRLQNESRLQELFQDVSDELTRRYETASAIERSGNKIVLPEYMTLKDAFETLYSHYKSAEEETETVLKFTGHPDDCLHAFYRAMSNVFGQLTGRAEKRMTFFGPQTIKRAKTRTVQTDYGETELLPVGLVQAPGLPVSMDVKVHEHDRNIMQSQVHVQCGYIRKFQPLVDMIREETQRVLKHESIFQGKALDSRFNFINLNGFPLERIVYTDSEHAQLSAHLFAPIQKRDHVVRAGVSLKRTVLLSGPYGTGKTLTALLCANLCVENGWTFINVLPGDDLTAAFQFAQKYQPSMVFCEDIDRMTQANENRSDGVNAVLNTIDGLLSKSAQVMTIVTTNYVDTIERAMTRPGRIDAIIDIGSVDATSLGKLIQSYCGDSLGETPDVERLISIAHGYTPAFIAEACNRALLYSLARNGKKINNDDLAQSLEGLRPQYDLMVSDVKAEKPSIDGVLHGILDKTIRKHIESNGLREIVENAMDSTILERDLEYVPGRTNEILRIVDDIAERL